MTKILRLIKIEMKRAIKSLPQLIIGAIVLSIMIGTIAFCSGKFLYHNSSLVKVSIGLVVDNKSTNMDWVLDFMSSMKSTENLIDFQIEPLDKAYELLDNGEYSAIMIIPDDVLGSIIDGTNQHIQVVFSKSTSISNVLLQELTLSGAKTLSSAQSSIYAITDLYLEKGLSSSLDDTQLELNISNLQYALMRDELFHTISTSTTGSISVSYYYAASGILLFLLLWGTTYSYFLRKDLLSFRQKLTCLGINSTSYVLIKFFVTFTTYLIGSGLLLAAFLFFWKRTWQLNYNISLSAGISFITILLCVSAFVIFLYELAPTPTSGILLLFIFSILLIFLSGGFIPSAFFPDNIRILSKYLPTSYLIDEIIHVIISNYQENNIFHISFYTFLFLVITIGIHHIRRTSHS